MTPPKQDPGRGYDQWLMSGGQGVDADEQTKEAALRTVERMVGAGEGRDEVLAMLGLVRA